MYRTCLLLATLITLGSVDYDQSGGCKNKARIGLMKILKKKDIGIIVTSGQRHFGRLELNQDKQQIIIYAEGELLDRTPGVDSPGYIPFEITITGLPSDKEYAVHCDDSRNSSFHKVEPDGTWKSGELVYPLTHAESGLTCRLVMDDPSEA